MADLVRIIALSTFALSSQTSCSGDPAPSGITLTLQKWDSVQHCFGTVGGDTIDLNVHAGDCPAAAGDLLGGADLLRLVISYGDLKFSNGTVTPAPTLAMTLDGVDTPPDAAIALAQASGPTAYFAVFTAPARAVNQLDLSVTVAPGFSHNPIGPFRVSTPGISLAVQECVSDAGVCTLRAAVGSVVLSLSEPGVSATTVTLTSILGGVQQPTPLPNVTLQPDPARPNVVSGVGYVTVPAAPDTTQWQIQAQSTVGPPATATITLAAPQISARIDGCANDAGSTCVLKAGQGVNLFVTAPRLIASPHATITPTVGAITSPAETLDLTAVDINADTISGSIAIVAPTVQNATAWTLVTNVDGYLAPTLVASVGP